MHPTYSIEEMEVVEGHIARELQSVSEQVVGRRTRNDVLYLMWTLSLVVWVRSK